MQQSEVPSGKIEQPAVKPGQKPLTAEQQRKVDEVRGQIEKLNEGMTKAKEEQLAVNFAQLVQGLGGQLSDEVTQDLVKDFSPENPDALKFMKGLLQKHNLRAQLDNARPDRNPDEPPATATSSLLKTIDGHLNTVANYLIEDSRIQGMAEKLNMDTAKLRAMVPAFISAAKSVLASVFDSFKFLPPAREAAVILRAQASWQTVLKVKKANPSSALAKKIDAFGSEKKAEAHYINQLVSHAQTQSLPGADSSKNTPPTPEQVFGIAVAAAAAPQPEKPAATVAAATETKLGAAQETNGDVGMSFNDGTFTAKKDSNAFKTEIKDAKVTEVAVVRPPNNGAVETVKVKVNKNGVETVTELNLAELKTAMADPQKKTFELKGITFSRTNA